MPHFSRISAPEQGPWGLPPCEHGIATRVRKPGDVPPADARNPAAAIRHLPAGERAYKGIAALAEPLAEWLSTRA